MILLYYKAHVIQSCYLQVLTGDKAALIRKTLQILGYIENSTRDGVDAYMSGNTHLIALNEHGLKT